MIRAAGQALGIGISGWRKAHLSPLPVTVANDCFHGCVSLQCVYVINPEQTSRLRD